MGNWVSEWTGALAFLRLMLAVHPLVKACSSHVPVVDRLTKHKHVTDRIGVTTRAVSPLWALLAHLPRRPIPFSGALHPQQKGARVGKSSSNLRLLDFRLHVSELRGRGLD